MATVTLTFISEDGPLTDQRGTVQPGGATDFDLSAAFASNYVNRVLGHRIVANQPVTVTHTIGNQTHGAAIAGATGRGTHWRFLENRSAEQYDKWLELANFSEAEAIIRVSYQTSKGLSQK